MHRFHAGLTVAAPVKPGQADALKRTIRQRKHNRQYFDFDKAESLFFISVVVLPAQDYHGELLPETLLLSTSYSGPLTGHLADLTRTAGQGLVAMLQHCQHFPAGNLDTHAAVTAYLHAYALRSTFSSRLQCMTRRQVQQEKQLRKTIETYLDKAQRLDAFQGLTCLQIRGLIQRHLLTHEPEYDWALQRDKKTGKEWYLLNERKIWTWTALSLVVVLVWVNRMHLSAIVMPTLLLFVFFLFALPAITSHITRFSTPPAPRPSDAHNRQLMATQLRPVLNEMTATAPLKKGRLRRHFYASILRIVSALGPGFLNTPTVATIRWLVIDKGKRLVFLSNFANTSDSYVRDFLTGKGVRWMVNFMFSNGVGFPHANWSFFQGVYSDPEGYMNAVHSGQQVNDLWYAHEPDLTTDIIRKNHRIRNGLFQPMTEEQARQWLHLL